MNLLCKGSEKHCTFQLQKTVQEHVEDIKQTIKKAKEVGLKINLYLEDWSNGIQYSPQYVFHLMDALKNEAVERFMLPDTLGILNPLQTLKFCRAMRRRYPDLRFDFHAHNDYDLATANTFAATLTGIQGVHCTVNGLGERAGNAPLTSVVAVLHDHVKATTGITENMVNKVSRIVESYSGIRVAPINLLLRIQYLLNVREFMPTEIIRTIFITMIYYPNDSGGNANMHLARLPGEPISAKISNR